MHQEVDVQWISKAQTVPSSVRQKLCSMRGSKQESLLLRRWLSKKRHETPKCSDGDEKLRDPHVPSCDPAPLRDFCFPCRLTASSDVGFCSMAGGCLRCLQGDRDREERAGAGGVQLQHSNTSPSILVLASFPSLSMSCWGQVQKISFSGSCFLIPGDLPVARGRGAGDRECGCASLTVASLQRASRGSVGSAPWETSPAHLNAAPNGCRHLTLAAPGTAIPALSPISQ